MPQWLVNIDIDSRQDYCSLLEEFVRQIAVFVTGDKGEDLRRHEEPDK